MTPGGNQAIVSVTQFLLFSCFLFRKHLAWTQKVYSASYCLRYCSVVIPQRKISVAFVIYFSLCAVCTVSSRVTSGLTGRGSVSGPGTILEHTCRLLGPMCRPSQCRTLVGLWLLGNTAVCHRVVSVALALSCFINIYIYIKSSMATTLIWIIEVSHFHSHSGYFEGSPLWCKGARKLSEEYHTLFCSPLCVHGSITKV